MKKFRFTKTVILQGIEYKEGQELKIVDNEVLDAKGDWVFDADSLNAYNSGIVINT